MKKITLAQIENEKLKKLKEAKLDQESMDELRKKIKKVDDDTRTSLGKQLLDLVSNKGTTSEEEITKQAMNLILAGADLEYKNEEKGDYPLLICIRRGFLETAYLLLRAGANINQKSNFLTTPTMIAARYGHAQILELLILLGADVNARYLDGENALMSAQRHNNLACYKLLVSAGSSLNIRSELNQTVFDIPASERFSSPSELLCSIEQEKRVTHEDATALIEEAKKRLIKIQSSDNTSSK